MEAIVSAIQEEGLSTDDLTREFQTIQSLIGDAIVALKGAVRTER